MSEQAKTEQAKPMNGWAWAANLPKAHYFKDSARSICGKVMIFGVLDILEQGNDQSLDNCVQCKKKLLGGEAEVVIKIKTVFKCKRCGRVEKSDYVSKKKIKLADKGKYPKEEIVDESPQAMLCWCESNGYECPECKNHINTWNLNKCNKCGWEYKGDV